MHALFAKITSNLPQFTTDFYPTDIWVNRTLNIISNQYSFNVPSVNDPLTVAVARKAALNFISQNQILIGSSLTQ